MNESKPLTKTIRIQQKGGQTTITIPKVFVGLLDLNKGDQVDVSLIFGSGKLTMEKSEVDKK